MTRTLTSKEIETIRAYPTAEQADADSRLRKERRKEGRSKDTAVEAADLNHPATRRPTKEESNAIM